jgi:hypothetical protein
MSSVSNGYGGRLMRLNFLAFVLARRLASKFCTGPVAWRLSFVLDPSHGVSSSATVPRAGLGPATPPKCRCATHTMRRVRDHGG